MRSFTLAVKGTVAMMAHNMLKKLAIIFLIANCASKPNPYGDTDWDEVFDDEDYLYCDFWEEEGCEEYPDYYYF